MPVATKDETTWSLVGGDGGDEEGEDGEDDGHRVAELLQPRQGGAAMGGQGEPMGARTRLGARDPARPSGPLHAHIFNHPVFQQDRDHQRHWVWD